MNPLLLLALGGGAAYILKGKKSSPASSASYLESGADVRAQKTAQAEAQAPFVLPPLDRPDIQYRDPVKKVCRQRSAFGSRRIKCPEDTPTGHVTADGLKVLHSPWTNSCYKEGWWPADCGSGVDLEHLGRASQSDPGKVYAEKVDFSDELNKVTMDEIDKMSKEAKCAMVDELNAYLAQQGAPPVSCDDNAAAILGASMTVAGAAACAATGVGASVSVLCGMVGGVIGKWLGPKLEEAWGDVKEWVGGAVDDVGGAIEDGYKWATGWI